jgi:glycosyltransferase involved in cell wall biosynthesis
MAPRLSIVVIGFDMRRELPRTVTSLLPPYQQGIRPGDVEIIVVDNGSSEPICREWFPEDAAISVVRVDDGGVSPCRAINRGAALARADQLAIVIDGARMASPGLIATALAASSLHPDSFVATLGFHLGPKVQQLSVTEGYTRGVEDELLRGIGWPHNGYRLFEICALGGSYVYGVLRVPPETTFFVMKTAMFHAIGRYDERFVQLGGGLASFDFFRRAAEASKDSFSMLVGEGTFHQLHYGATTREGGISRPHKNGVSLGTIYMREYEQIVGRPFRMASQTPLLFGRITHPDVPRLFFGSP